MSRISGIVVLAGALGSGPACAGELAAPEPTTYRISDYREPTPATLAGARVVTPSEAHDLWLGKAAAFVDVLPQAPRPAGLPASTIWRDKPRHDIPGSIWLPDTGYGQLPTFTEDYFETGLEKASGGDKARPIVIYCLASCWMSWNAAKRALSYGYSQIIWFPEGTDGWQAADFPLEVRLPEAR